MAARGSTVQLRTTREQALDDPALTLSSSDYGDAATYAEERQRLFHPARGPVFLGHDAMLAGRGHVRAAGDDRVLLTRAADGRLRALANVCSHALRPLVETPAPSTRDCVTCPYHQWSYGPDGASLGTRGFACDDETRRSLALPSFPITSWHGLLFAGSDAAGPDFAADLARIDAAFAQEGVADWLDFGDWALSATEEDGYEGDWKSFLEVYGDCYHVPPFHAGLASFADCTTLTWDLGHGAHAQFVGLSAAAGGRSPRYIDWYRGMQRYHELRGEALPHLAVAWTAFYPNLMVEYYLGLRVLSVVVPTGPASYLNRAHFFVPPDMEALVPGLASTIHQAYGETAVEDRQLNESRYRGIVAARELGLGAGRATYRANLSGPAPEAGTPHFYRWWRDRMGRPGS